VLTCIWPSWCHCHSLSLASVKPRLVLPFWYQLTWVVPGKGLLNGCVCVRVCTCLWLGIVEHPAGMSDYLSMIGHRHHRAPSWREWLPGCTCLWLGIVEHPAGVSGYLGLDLQDILRLSCDYLTMMRKLGSTYDWRLIYKISYEDARFFLHTVHLQNHKIVWDSVRKVACDIPKRNVSMLQVAIAKLR